MNKFKLPFVFQKAYFQTHFKKGVAGLLPPELERGMGYLKKAYELGDKKAMGISGRFYHFDQQYEEAFVWYYKSALEGDASSQWEVAQRLEQGMGVEKSISRVGRPLFRATLV